MQMTSERAHIVLIETPYRANDIETRARNLRYLAWCEYHSAELGEVPISSHGNCTAYWPEDEVHRAMGFAWRDRIRSVCDQVAYYIDLGMSDGALAALNRDNSYGYGFTAERRMLPAELRLRFQRGEYPPGATMRRQPVE
jgi:hypothetical protein